MKVNFFKIRVNIHDKNLAVTLSILGKNKVIFSSKKIKDKICVHIYSLCILYPIKRKINN